MMDTFELNKIAGAILGTCLLVVGLQNVAAIIYHSPAPEKPGLEVEVAETTDGAEEAGEAEETVPLATLLASASAEDGQAQARKCGACHTFEQGGANKIGPNLYDVVGRPKASVEGFSYSDAMAATEGNWTFEDLFAFIENPKGMVPGTKMAFAGLRNPEQRADLLMYLRSLSADPAPLPEAPAAEEQAPAEQAPEAAESQEQPATEQQQPSPQEQSATPEGQSAAPAQDEQSSAPAQQEQSSEPAQPTSPEQPETESQSPATETPAGTAEPTQAPSETAQ